MPRNGSGVYFTPAGTDGIPDQTIESAKYNLNVHDVELDLNTPRPIVAGGTGASNAHDALVALSGEEANQSVVNYDSHVFASGSFYSLAGASGAPNSSDIFEGICYTAKPGFIDFYIEARSLTTNTKYMRRKSGSGWSAWTIADGSDKVAKAGDIMTGNLSIAKSTPLLYLNRADTAGAVVTGAFLSVNRWSIILGDATAESSPNNGSNFSIYRFDNVGILIDAPLTIFRNTGGTAIKDLHIIGSLQVDVTTTCLGNLTINSAASLFVRSGSIYFQDDTKFLSYSTGTSKFSLSSNLDIAGNLLASGTITVSGANPSTSTTTGALQVSAGGVGVFGAINAGGVVTGTGDVCAKSAVAGNSRFILQDNTGAARGFCYWDRALDTVNLINGTGNGILISPTSIVKVGNGMFGKAGTAGAYDTNAHNFYWTGSAAQVWIDTSNVGNLTITCDYRIKKDVEPLRGMWRRVKRLRPIRYTQKEFTPAGAAQPLFVNDDTLRWGFLAHELQDVLLPTAASGSKDAEHEIQSPNLLAIVAALTKALQEAMERIEALEAGQRTVLELPEEE